jgi:hypothetical protein
MTDPVILPLPGSSRERFYPLDCLVAVIGSDEQAQAVADALRGAGFSAESGRVVSGAEVLAGREAARERRSPAERFERAPADNEHAIEEEYVAAAGRGDHLAIVRAPTVELRDRVRRILAEHGGSAVRYYDRATIEDV